jgi:MFS family permease
MAVQWVPAAERASAISFTYANFNLGGVIGLTMVPLLADAFGGGGAFVISGAFGVGWAVAGAVIMQKVANQQPPDNAVAGTAAAAAAEQAGVAASSGQTDQISQQHKQQQGPQQQQQQQPSNGQQPQFSWQLDEPSMRQVALLCFAHAVIGFGFFLMQVRVTAFH